MVTKKILITLLISLQLSGNYAPIINDINSKTTSYVKDVENLISPKDKQIKIAIIDTGVKSRNCWFKGANMVNIDISNNLTKPDYYHGTMVMGIIVAMLRATAQNILSKVELISIIMGNGASLSENDLILAIEKAILASENICSTAGTLI